MANTSSYLRLCEDFDTLPQIPTSCYKLFIEGYDGIYGHIIESVALKITWNFEQWEVNHTQRYVKLLGETAEQKQTAIDELLANERAKDSFKVLRKFRDERFAIYGPGREVIATFERSGSTLLGLVTYGVQLIVYQEREGQLFVWVSKRAASKILYPNFLSVAVAGCLPAGKTPFQCLIRESYEEASFPESLIKKDAKAAGTITSVSETNTEATSGGESGLIWTEVQYMYDLKVGPDVIPQCNDDEVAGFHLYSIPELKQAIEDGKLTPGDACYFLDFFIRHGLTTFENEPNYTQIVSRLHRPLEVQTL